MRAFARVTRACALAAVALGLGASALVAQATGKVEGRVRDEAGAPIANAQVTVVGTAFSALSNAQGYYFMNNVPAGTYSMRAAFIGYRAVRTDGVRVLAGQTAANDFALTASTVVIEDIVVTSDQPLVPRDEVTTRQRISGEFTNALPVDNISQVLTLQPGVVANSSGTGLSIRGGRTDEAATYVDGVPTTPGNRGTFLMGVGGGVDVSKSGFEEASVTTGASSAEYGNAQSGIINIVTKTGSSTAFNGALGWETDEPFPSTQSVGYNRINAGFGGPLMGGLTFYIAGALTGNRTSFGGTDSENHPSFMYAGVDTTVAVPAAPGVPTSDTTFVDVYNLAIARGRCDLFANSVNEEIANNYGAECGNARNPRNASSSYGVQGKLNYSFGTGSRISALVLASQSQVRGGITTNSDLTTIRSNRDWSRVYQLNWTQNLSKSAERALALDASISYQTDRVLNSFPLTPEAELGSRGKFGGFMITPLDLMFDLESFPLDTTLLNNIKFNRLGTRRAPYDVLNPDQYNSVNQYRNSGYGTLGGSESGPGGGTLNISTEDRLIAKAAVDWQLDRYNRLKLGGEHTWYDTRHYDHSLTSQAFADVYFEEPIRWNAFLEDRLDLGDVVLVGGVRYDVYNTRAERPYVLDTLRTLPGTGGQANPNYGEYHRFPRIYSYTDPDGVATVNGVELPLITFIPDARHDYISPHIQVSFPVTDRTNFRLSYAHQVQVPDFSLMFAGMNTDLSSTNTNHTYGSDLDFGKSVTFEFGIRHAFSDDMVLDVAAYNKDKLSDATARLVNRRDPIRLNASADLREFTNFDFGNSRGIDVRLDRRIGSLFNGTIAYSYSTAKNTGSDPTTYLRFGSRVLNALSGGNQPPPQAIAPTSESRPHNLAGAFSIAFPSDFQEGTTAGSLLQDFGVFGTFRFASGTAYTRCEDSSGNESTLSGQVCDRGNFEGGLNTARLPGFKQLDLRFTKGLALGGLDLTAYLDVRNILNFRNVLQVFVVTDDIVSDRDRELENASQFDSWQNEATANDILLDNGDIDFRFGGAGDAGCASYVTTQGEGGAPSCIYMIRTEERWGDGDRVFTVTEQERVANELYDVNRGEYAFLGDGRRMRLGFELNF
ncbi:MAG TPA: TonB-dependent receptor [Gemmatimonadales bacterium]|nr:TonB-dependent receptor [Gemmatimonadales bacterium]